jgi:putative FmdB family regulatory protein
MPLYEYQCLDCTKTFEKRQPFEQANAQTKCPTCESERTHKVFGLIAVVGGSRMTDNSYSSGFEMGGGCACGGACGCQH